MFCHAHRTELVTEPRGSFCSLSCFLFLFDSSCWLSAWLTAQPVAAAFFCEWRAGLQQLLTGQEIIKPLTLKWERFTVYYTTKKEKNKKHGVWFSASIKVYGPWLEPVPTKAPSSSTTGGKPERWEVMWSAEAFRKYETTFSAVKKHSKLYVRQQSWKVLSLFLNKGSRRQMCRPLS